MAQHLSRLPHPLFRVILGCPVGIYTGKGGLGFPKRILASINGAIF